MPEHKDPNAVLTKDKNGKEIYLCNKGYKSNRWTLNHQNSPHAYYGGNLSHAKCIPDDCKDANAIMSKDGEHCYCLHGYVNSGWVGYKDSKKYAYLASAIGKHKCVLPPTPQEPKKYSSTGQSGSDEQKILTNPPPKKGSCNNNYILIPIVLVILLAIFMIIYMSKK